MHLEEISHNKIIVDGQEIYPVDDNMLNMLKENPEIDGIKIGSKDMIAIIEKKFEFTKKNTRFIFGLCLIKTNNRSFWLGEMFYKCLNKWYRVHIENSICKKCETIWTIANPYEYSLFNYVKDKEYILNEILQLEKLKCPKCMGELSRFAIWIE